MSAGLPPEILEVAELLGELPGIGAASREKLAVVLALKPDLATKLGLAVGSLPAAIGLCRRCNYLTNRGALCGYCLDTKRDDGLLCVVARVRDVGKVEASGEMRGRYFVLGGLVSPLDGAGAATLPLQQLLGRLLGPTVQEVLIATPPTVDGDATALVIAAMIRDAYRRGDFDQGEELGAPKVTRIATGVGANSDLSYLDPITIGKAVGARVAMADGAP